MDLCMKLFPQTLEYQLCCLLRRQFVHNKDPLGTGVNPASGFQKGADSSFQGFIALEKRVAISLVFEPGQDSANSTLAGSHETGEKDAFGVGGEEFLAIVKPLSYAV
jgi:hypothetical protein